MRFLRAILGGFFYLMFGVGGLLFSFVLLFPVPQSTARRMLRRLFRFFVWLGGATGLFRVEVSHEDRRRLAAFSGAVVVSNHQTLIDAVILISLLGDSVCVTKEAVSRNPFMRVVARSILVVNEGPVAVMRQAVRYLSAGVNVLVFPEGTRIPKNAPEHVFRRGAAHIALQSKAPVEPILLECDADVLGKGQPWWDVKDRTVVYKISSKGTVLPSNFPRETVDMGAKQAAAELTAMMHRGIFGS